MLLAAVASFYNNLVRIVAILSQKYYNESMSFYLKKSITCLGLIIFSFSVIAKNEIKENRPKNELSLYRYIMHKSKANYQDLADVIFMQEGRFDLVRNSHKRLKYIKKLGINFLHGGNHTTRGSVAKVALLVNNLEFGVLFAITKWEYYAIRDIQALNIMLPKYTTNQQLSGKQLISVLDNALREKKKKILWVQK